LIKGFDDMHKTNILRTAALSLSSIVCFLGVMAIPAAAQNGSMLGHFRSVVYDGSTQAGWYSFPGQQPKLHFSGDQVRITSREHSTVLLSRSADAAGTTAEVSLARAPISTSSISGLAVLTDAQHAMVIGLEGGNVVLWQLDPAAARVVARQPVNGSSPLEFRVTGGNGTDVGFFWRHPKDSAWHPLGNSVSKQILASWREPLRFGLLLDGPQGSQVTFSNYRNATSDMASNFVPKLLPAALTTGQ
jgi:hypothetical protein